MWSDKEKPVKAKPAKEEDEDDSDDKKIPVKEDPGKAAADLKKLRLDFLSKLSTKVLTATDKPFLNPTEQFNVLVWYKQDKTYKEEKVELFRGKYQFKAKSYQEAVEKFVSLITPLAEKDNDVEFGLVGNKKLVLTTSAFKKHISSKAEKYEGTGEEYLEDPISMLMLAEGLK